MATKMVVGSDEMGDVVPVVIGAVSRPMRGDDEDVELEVLTSGSFGRWVDCINCGQKLSSDDEQ